MASSSNKGAAIPAFPGIRPPKTAPAPPKYLVISDSSGEERRVEVKRADGLHPLQLKQPEFPVVETRYTSARPPPKDFSQPAHRYKRPVDSRSEAKEAAQSGAVIKYAGTSYRGIPNAPARGYVPRPTHPTVPRPFMPLASKDFTDSPALANRTANGAILGSLTTKRYVDSEHVPYLPPDMPLGPDNPSKDLNETWSAHWDDEAGAVYYYNKLSGEATWISPI